jgi:hypothetical protein
VKVKWDGNIYVLAFTLYQRKIEARIGEKREKGNVEEIWKKIEKVIKEVADETVGKEGNQRNKNCSEKNVQK